MSSSSAAALELTGGLHAAAARPPSRRQRATYAYRGLYLLHFDPPYKHARHYLGYAKRELPRYAADVAAGRAHAPHPLIEAALMAGCELAVVDLWPAHSREHRRRLRACGSLSRFCPTCRAAGEHHA